MNFNELFNYLKNKYPEPQVRGKNFELYAKWFLENDSVYKKMFKKVWLWDDWPDRWGPDDGIDLIGEDSKGKIWSIQSKNYAENNIIKKGIDSFIAQSSHKDIYGMYLLTTSDNISPNSLRQMHNSEKPTHIIGVSELSRIEWPKEEDLNKKISIVKATPEPHQKVAIKNVSEGFKKEDRGKLIMACGTGKTLTGLWIKEKIKSKKTIVFFPSLGLLSDTLAEYCKHGEDKFNFLCVCSDISVTKGADDYLDKTDSLSFPTTTQTDEIVEFLNKEEDSIIFSTYQSSPKIEEATKKIKDFSFDLAIFDEAHRTTGKEDKTFTKALNDKNIKCKKRLFMTATPKFASKITIAKAKEFDQEIISMDDENLYGKNFYELKFSQAIKENLLSDYRVVICGVLDSEIKKMIDKRTFVQLGEMTGDSETFANYISLAKTLKKYEIKSLITYHSNIKRAKELRDNFIKIVNESNIKLEDSLFTDHINGAHPANKRKEILDKLRDMKENTAGIVTNARCLTEGIDVPSLDGIAFVDPRQSQVDVIQAVGRAIRKVRGSNKKKIGTIVIPIFITNEEEIDEVADKSAYKKIWQVLNALKDHDDLLRVEIENLRFHMGKRSLSPKPGITKIIYDIETKIGSKFVENLIIRTIKRCSLIWEEWYGILLRYVKQKGNCNILKWEKFENRDLGLWVFAQRGRKRFLSSEQIKKLDEVGFYWSINDSSLVLVKELGESLGHINVGVSMEYRGYAIGKWLYNRRNQKINNSLDIKIEEELNALGIIWDMWEMQYYYLKEFIKSHGHTNVPYDYKIKDIKINLGSWLKLQIGSKGLLERRKAKLEALGIYIMKKTQIKDESYLAMLSLYKEYSNEFEPYVPVSKIYKGKALGKWCAGIRGRFNNGKLPNNEIKELNKLGFIWDASSSGGRRKIEEQKRLKAWDLRMNMYKDYLKENKMIHPMISLKYKGFGIGAWAHNQRLKKNLGKLTNYEIERLDKVGFPWNQAEVSTKYEPEVAKEWYESRYKNKIK